MQATAINNLKKAKGVDISKDSTPQGPGKGDLLQVCVWERERDISMMSPELIKMDMKHLHISFSSSYTLNEEK